MGVPGVYILVVVAAILALDLALHIFWLPNLARYVLAVGRDVNAKRVLVLVDTVAVGALDGVQLTMLGDHMGQGLGLGAGIGVITQRARPPDALFVKNVLEHIATLRLLSVKRTCNRTNGR